MWLFQLKGKRMLLCKTRAKFFVCGSWFVTSSHNKGTFQAGRISSHIKTIDERQTTGTTESQGWSFKCQHECAFNSFYSHPFFLFVCFQHCLSCVSIYFHFHTKDWPLQSKRFFLQQQHLNSSTSSSFWQVKNWTWNDHLCFHFFLFESL